ncbi:MAG: hypothetical protein D6682_03360 [Zetaproteobacteria bacterium]|nr:MAG: hypothetical protein D6682_03360 [Zetaproteobacteria bacterium]
MLARRILANTAFNTAGRLWLLLVNLFLTPLVLSYLGDRRFALWALFWTLQSWVAFTDLGIGVAVVRSVSSLAGRGGSIGMNTILCTALAFNGGVALLLLFCSWLFAEPLVVRLHVGAALQGDALAIALLGPVVFLLLALISVFDNFLRGRQRYDLINLVAVLVSLVNATGIWIVLHFGYGITGLLLSCIVVYLLQLLALGWSARAIFPAMRLRWRYVRVGRLLRMLPFGIHLQAARLAELASYQADKFILALFTPLYFVTAYDVGSKVAALLRQVPYLLTSAIFPVVAQLHAEGDRDRLWKIYRCGSKYLWMVSTPLFAGLCVTAPFVLKLWLNHVSPDVLRAVLVLAFGFWVTVNTSVAYNVGTGMGWSRPVMQLSLVQAVANVALSWWLAATVGFVGVLCATAGTLAVTNLWMHWWFCRDFGHRYRKDVVLFARVCAANLPPVAVVVGYVWLEGVAGGGATRATAGLALLWCVGLYGITYLLAIRLFRLLDEADRGWLGRFVPALLAQHLFAG